MPPTLMFLMGLIMNNIYLAIIVDSLFGNIPWSLLSVHNRWNQNIKYIYISYSIIRSDSSRSDIWPNGRKHSPHEWALLLHYEVTKAFIFLRTTRFRRTAQQVALSIPNVPGLFLRITACPQSKVSSIIIFSPKSRESRAEFKLGNEEYGSWHGGRGFSFLKGDITKKNRWLNSANAKISSIWPNPKCFSWVKATVEFPLCFRIILYFLLSNFVKG